MRAAALSLLVASLLAGVGCFKPNVLPGTLQCSMPGDKCPDNFKCDKSNPQLHLCVSSMGGAGGGATQGTGGKAGSGGTAGSGGKAGSGVAGAGGMGGKAGAGGAAGAACLPKVSNCTTTFDGGACDPVCNVGCASCDQKCSVNSTGAVTCNPLYPPASSGGHDFDYCNPYLPPTDPSRDSDDCGPGLACVNHNACSNRCYRFCRTIADCPTGSPCSIDAGGGHFFCDTAVANCDPVNGVQNTPQEGCVNPLESCYLLGDRGTTTCDCYNTGAGYPVGHSCTESRDCFAGLVCTSFTGTGPKACRKVCRLPPTGGTDPTKADAGDEHTCTAVSSCVPILLSDRTHSTVFGACNE
ncbi:MAG: hypothetical protein ABUS79_14700 [Pseudomonadota bacterium]